MIKAILLALGLILAISGLCEFIHGISLLMNCPDGPHKSCSVIWLRKDKARRQLRFASLQLKWLGCAYAETVIAITDSISQQETEELKESFSEGFVFCPAEAVQNIIRSISGETDTNGRSNESQALTGSSRDC